MEKPKIINNVMVMEFSNELRDAVRAFSIVFGSAKSGLEFIELLFDRAIVYSIAEHEEKGIISDESIHDIHSSVIDDLYYNGLDYCKYIDRYIDGDKKPKLYDRIHMETEDTIIQELDYTIYVFCEFCRQTKLYTMGISNFFFRHGKLFIKLKEGV